MTKKILIVDDNKGCCELYQQRFEIDGYEVKSVFSAEEALKILESGYKPNAILLDILLPKMQGDELLPLLKSNPKYQDIKIIVFTALTLKPEHEKKIIDQADDYVLKMDLTPKELVERVDKLILE